MLLYFHQDDGQATGLFHTRDDGNEWWGGVQLSFASIAIAATLAISSNQTTQANQQYKYDQQEQATGLHTVPGDDNEYWLQSELPSPQLWPVNIPSPYIWEQNEQANGLYTGRDEDFWQNPVLPQLWTTTYPQPWTFEQNDQTFLYVDEVYWQLGPLPQLWPTFQNLPLSDTDEWPTPVAPVFQPDEDFWNSSVAPQLWPIFQALPLSDTDEWPTPVAPVFQPDEDFWTVTQPWPLPSTLGLYWFYTDETIPKLDEDYWALQQACLSTYQWPQPYSFEQYDLAYLIVISSGIVPWIADDFG